MTLFDPPAARHSDPATSHEAAASITPGRTEELILQLFARNPGAEWTDDQIVTRLPECYPPTVKSARSRLTKAERLVDAGYRDWSDRGRSMIVWRLSDAHT